MDVSKVVKNKLCIGCGLCTYDSGIPQMVYSNKRGLFLPSLKHEKNYTVANKICPGNGYEIIKESKHRYGEMKYSIELGYVHKTCAAHSNDKKILKNASSGGIMTEILFYLLKNKIVDKVVTTKFQYTDTGPKTITFLTDDDSELLKSQGSKYCPVDISNVISEIKKFEGKIAFVGTPCQIAGIRAIQKIDMQFDKKIIYTIANFCGGFKSFNQIKKITKRHNVDFRQINFLRYRGGGQPGSMMIKDKAGNRFEESYRIYGGYTGYSKLLRCHLCVDATGELADIACGDAWIDKYLSHKFPWSVVITRNKKSSSLLKRMNDEKVISMEEISHDDVCKSQKQNLVSKKHRQFTRFKLYKRLGFKLPNFDGAFYEKNTSLKTEITVFSIHQLKLFAEKIGMYPLLRIILRKSY